MVARPPSLQKSSAANSQGNIAHHYDLSNDLFNLFLDPTLSYSSALFEDPAAASRDNLEAAQGRKIERLLDQAGVTAGSRVLEIGSGWGELAIRAARRGATVTHDHARRWSRRRWPRSGSRRPGSALPVWPTACRSSSATTATSPAPTTPWCRSR